MDHSPIARLPAELRNVIYALMFRREGNTALTLVPKWRTPGRHPTNYETTVDPPFPHGSPLALTGVCRQLRQETIGVFFSINNFRFPICLSKLLPPAGAYTWRDGVDGLRKWLDSQDIVNIIALGNIRIDGGLLKCYSMCPYSLDGRLKELAKDLAEVSGNLSSLASHGASFFLRVIVRYHEEASDHSASVQLWLPLHDRQALQTVVAETVASCFDERTSTRTSMVLGLGGEDFTARKVAVRGCRDAMDVLVKALLEELK